MQRTPRHFPVYVRTGWIDFSPALHSHVERRLTVALTPFASRVASVKVRVAGNEPADLAARTCTIDVNLKAGGTLSLTLAGPNVYDVIDRASDAVGAMLRQHAPAIAAH